MRDYLATSSAKGGVLSSSFGLSQIRKVDIPWGWVFANLSGSPGTEIERVVLIYVLVLHSTCTCYSVQQSSSGYSG